MRACVCACVRACVYVCVCVCMCVCACACMCIIIIIILFIYESQEKKCMKSVCSSLSVSLKYLNVFLKVNFTGGTGYVSFDESGDRLGYSGKDKTSKPLCQTS